MGDLRSMEGYLPVRDAPHPDVSRERLEPYPESARFRGFLWRTKSNPEDSKKGTLVGTDRPAIRLGSMTRTFRSCVGALLGRSYCRPV
jgi:hypothetical protein